MKPRIVAFGDSFVSGDQDDFGPKDPNYRPECHATHTMSDSERNEYLKYNVSFASLIAKNLNFDFLNLSQRGAGNFYQLDRLLTYIRDRKLQNSDIILFGITSVTRDRLSVLPESIAESIFDWSLTFEPTNLYETIEKFDYYYVLSILNNISHQYNVRIIAFKLLYNPV